ncbi:MAG: phosphatase PAP2 family protein [Lachnospiraceae bacterium]|nr:phosphatase PAP2 family protein [Lachnospiraceae bacterium]
MEWEFRILDTLQLMRTPAGDYWMPLITRLAEAGAIWILLAIVLLIIPKTRKVGLGIVAALIIHTLLSNVILKNLVARTRPCDINKAVQLLVKRPWDYSFPSGHTGISFATVTVLFLAYRRFVTSGIKIGYNSTDTREEIKQAISNNELKKGLWMLWIGSLILSVAIAFSRLYLYVHFPTDVLGGILVGIISGVLGVAVSDRLTGK